MPNVAFWNVKKKAKTTVGMEKRRLRNAKSYAAEGRGGPAGWGCQCLPLLSGRWGWRNRGFEMPNPGSEQQQPGLESVGIAVASLTRSPVVGRGRRITVVFHSNSMGMSIFGTILGCGPG